MAAKDRRKAAEERRKALEDRRGALEEKIDAWEGGMFSKGDLYKRAKAAGHENPGAFKKRILASIEFQSAKKLLDFNLESGLTVKGKWFSPEECLDQAEMCFKKAEALVHEELASAVKHL